jgi:hypothetical protein
MPYQPGIELSSSLHHASGWQYTQSVTLTRSTIVADSIKRTKNPSHRQADGLSSSDVTYIRWTSTVGETDRHTSVSARDRHKMCHAHSSSETPCMRHTLERRNYNIPLPCSALWIKGEAISEDGGCNMVLAGRACRIAQSQLYTTWYIGATIPGLGKRKYVERNLAQCRFVQKKVCMEFPEIQPRFLRWESVV